eukprot:TRINITY_DN49950_c0_g1_i1.p1 TRINITY_DN49950_c0_g1~~TRINITY_DN49950_c0_g1_i1.p1  ORF type:complete len:224 (+),score=51.38 TRINITY_DN49950_c0_g1_i1:104-775(+)
MCIRDSAHLTLVLLLLGAASGEPNSHAVRGSSMMAAVCSGTAPDGDFSKVELQSSEVPSPGWGQVLIKVRSSSVNPLDWKLIQDSFLPISMHFPRTMGTDVAGTIVGLGLGASRFKLGDRVWACLGKFKLLRLGMQLGGYAEYAVADEAQVGAAPEGMDLEDAGTLPLVGMTDLQALRKVGAPWAAGANWTVAITSGSVSYTHLRAHETPEHLVCRLLLEKKK